MVRFVRPPGEETPSKGTPSEGVPSSSPTRPAAPTRTRLVLHIGSVDTPHMISIPVQARMMVGRGSADEGIAIDLTRFGTEGVSRQHAVFHYTEDALCIEDLGSTNGTRINGKAIDAGLVCRLRPGDELEFGRLRVVARIVRG